MYERTDDQNGFMWSIKLFPRRRRLSESCYTHSTQRSGSCPAVAGSRITSASGEPGDSSANRSLDRGPGRLNGPGTGKMSMSDRPGNVVLIQVRDPKSGTLLKAHWEMEFVAIIGAQVSDNFLPVKSVSLLGKPRPRNRARSGCSKSRTDVQRVSRRDPLLWIGVVNVYRYFLPIGAVRGSQGASHTWRNACARRSSLSFSRIW